MEKPIITELDALTNEVTTREMTDAEYAEYLEQQANAPAPLTAQNE